jgi:hypothetical protein
MVPAAVRRRRKPPVPPDRPPVRTPPRAGAGRTGRWIGLRALRRRRAAAGMRPRSARRRVLRPRLIVRRGGGSVVQQVPVDAGQPLAQFVFLGGRLRRRPPARPTVGGRPPMAGLGFVAVQSCPPSPAQPDLRRRDRTTARRCAPARRAQPRGRLRTGPVTPRRQVRAWLLIPARRLRVKKARVGMAARSKTRTYPDYYHL